MTDARGGEKIGVDSSSCWLTSLLKDATNRSHIALALSNRRSERLCLTDSLSASSTASHSSIRGDLMSANQVSDPLITLCGGLCRLGGQEGSACSLLANNPSVDHSHDAQSSCLVSNLDVGRPDHLDDRSSRRFLLPPPCFLSLILSHQSITGVISRLRSIWTPCP